MCFLQARIALTLGSSALLGSRSDSKAMRLPTVKQLLHSLRKAASRLRCVALAAAHRPVLLAMLIVLVGAFDLTLTMRALDLGWLVELNPFTDSVIRNYGRTGLAFYRLIASAGGAALLYWALNRYANETAPIESARRIHAVVALGVVVLVTTHFSLVLWWAAWVIV